MKLKSIASMLASALVLLTLAAQAADPMKVGDTAPDFTLNTLDGKAVKLSEESARQPIVLVILRGWPGYTCPLCTRQVHEYVAHAADLTGKAKVIMVYPGAANDLEAHAQTFLADKQWPQDWLFVLDPDYTAVNAYGLRWAQPNETAYPSTFIIDTKGTIEYAKVSKGHGGRSTTAEISAALAAMK